MNAYNALAALKTMTATKTPRSKDQRDELAEDLASEFETVTECADAIEEKVTEIRELIDELHDAERADYKDFTQSIRTACEELTELLTA